MSVGLSAGVVVVVDLGKGDGTVLTRSIVLLSSHTYMQSRAAEGGAGEG